MFHTLTEFRQDWILRRAIAGKDPGREELVKTLIPCFDRPSTRRKDDVMGYRTSCYLEKMRLHSIDALGGKGGVMSVTPVFTQKCGSSEQ